MNIFKTLLGAGQSLFDSDNFLRKDFVGVRGLLATGVRALLRVRSNDLVLTGGRGLAVLSTGLTALLKVRSNDFVIRNNLVG